MKNFNVMMKSASLFTLMAILSTFSMAALAVTAPAAGEITATGQVAVNGTPAVSGSTVLSGSVISTGENSAATINLGSAGRFELLANSSVTLNFSAGEITAVMSTGKARVMNNAGVATTVTTKDAAILADAVQASSFDVEIECSHTHVDTFAGAVTMRSGTNDKMVAAGTNASVGNPNQAGCAPCYRPDSSVVPVASIGSMPVTAILLLIGGAIGTAVYVGQRGDSTTSGTATVISPAR